MKTENKPRTKFEFDGIERHGKYFSACYRVTISQEADTISDTIIRINVPINIRSDLSVPQLEQELLLLAREAIQTQPLQDWMDRQRKAQP